MKNRNRTLPENVEQRLHKLSDSDQRGVLWFMVGWSPRNAEHFVDGITRAIELFEDMQEKRNEKRT